MMLWLLTDSIPSLVLLSGWCLIGAAHRGQPWTLSLRLPHMRDGLSALRLAVWCPCHRSSMCRCVHRELTRNEVLDLTTIVPATACHQKNYVGTYSRSKLATFGSLNDRGACMQCMLGCRVISTFLY